MGVGGQSQSNSNSLIGGDIFAEPWVIQFVFYNLIIYDYIYLKKKKVN